VFIIPHIYGFLSSQSKTTASKTGLLQRAVSGSYLPVLLLALVLSASSPSPAQDLSFMPWAGAAGPYGGPMAAVGGKGELARINSERERFERRAMTALLGWGAANTAAGTALLFTDWHDAGLMTFSWGAINAGIALLAIRGRNLLDPADPGLADFLRREQQFQRIVAVNAGLNVSYITAGLLLQHYGGQCRTRQFGSAVALQGLFLLAFDSYLLYRSARYMSRVMPLLESASFAGKSDFVLPGIRVAW
jgi:hypothetical protein